MEEFNLKNTWDVGLPFIYTDKQGNVVKQYKDGRTEVIQKKPKIEDKNSLEDLYDQPFEDDGAYAEDDIE